LIPNRRSELIVIGILLGCLVISGLVSLAANGWARPVAHRIGLVDRPDGHRKLHSKPVPLVGGIAIFVSMALVLAALAGASPDWRNTMFAHWGEAQGLLAGSLLLIVVGVIDDARGLRGRQKLLGQVAATFLVVLGGICIHRVKILDFSLELGVFAIPFTMFWLLGAINALNLLDGIDGLVATLGLVLSLAVTVMAFVTGHESIAVISAILAGSILGFLRFNLPPASIYLGDAGSMFIGLAVGVLAIRASLKGPGTVLLAAPLALWTIPIFDSAAAILRRKLSGRSIYATDRAHLHHHLVDRIGHARTLICLAVVSIATSGAALVSVWWKSDAIALVCGTAVVLIFVALRVFGHSELQLLLARTRSFARSILMPHPPKAAGAWAKAADAWGESVRLQGTRQWELIWETLTESAIPLELVELRLDVNVPRLGEGFNATWNRPLPTDERDRVWRLELPLICDRRVMGTLIAAGRRDPVAGANLERLSELVEQVETHLHLLASDSPAESGQFAAPGETPAPHTGPTHPLKPAETIS
jgi:UDP-GlcNAc:undecaprenyl-phosphate/decaprenyl-phosphate GlcNAc-1-phosphate transferase